MNKFDINDIPEMEFVSSPKKRVNSIRKGKNFERFIAKDLTKRFNEKFLRVPCSGGLLGGQIRYFTNRLLEQNTKNILVGDIICPSWFPFVIELKHYKNEPKLYNLLNSSSSVFDKWVEQAKKEAQQTTNKKWLLIFKITEIKKNIFCAFNKNIISESLSSYLIYKDVGICTYENFWDKVYVSVVNKSTS